MPPSSDSSSVQTSTDNNVNDNAGFEVIRVETEIERENRTLTEWITTATEARRKDGVRVEALVRNNRAFRNPSILQKMIDFVEIDEYATALPRRQPPPPPPQQEQE